MDPAGPRGIRSSIDSEINPSITFINNNNNSSNSHLLMGLLPPTNPLSLLHAHTIL